jgi:tRNA threonylcarbamoyl adenosine modification protein (Sua5/YciO/YrdC/YwlC family)
MCRDLSEISKYAMVDNINYRLLKAHTPGSYTFILEANREIPRRLKHPKRKTIGIRIPDNNIALALLEELDQPLISSTLILPDDDFPMTDPYQIQLFLENQVDLIIDGGYSGHEATTVIDLMQSPPEVLREGKGDTQWLKSH